MNDPSLVPLYEALPLDAERSEIRLLILHPAGWHEPIRCDFNIVSLDDRPNYSALSYVWGQEKASDEISLRGCSFWVRPNLFKALRRLRAHGGGHTVTVWADSICINQESVAERNSQVAMMGEIYSLSERVHVWLGELEFASDIWPESSTATELGRCYDIPTVFNSCCLPSYTKGGADFQGALNALPQSEALLRICLFLQFIAERDDFVRVSYTNWNPTSNVRLEDHFGRVLHAIMKNPWFDRLWVVQEVVLAPEVTILMGPVSLPLDMFALASTAHIRRKQHPYYIGTNHKANTAILEEIISPFVNTASVREQIRGHMVNLTLAELRLELSRRAATVSHDQLYSLLGVSDFMRGAGAISTRAFTSKNGHERQPDYNGPPAGLYKAITQQHIEQKLDLLPLSISACKGSHPETQSWTIDWTVLQETQLDINSLLWTRIYGLFHADRGLMATAPGFRNEPGGFDILKLHGFSVDRIAVQTEFSSLLDDESAILLALRQHDPELPYLGMNGTTWLEAWLSCLTADSVMTPEARWVNQARTQPHRLCDDPDVAGFRTRGKYLLAAYDPWIKDASMRNCDQWDNTCSNSIWGKYKWYNNVPPHSPEVARLRVFREGLDAQVRGVTGGKMVFMTQQGYIGVTNKCKIGDEVCIVGGGKMPVILDRYSESYPQYSGYYRVVGDCYLHGFMDGEQNASFHENGGRLRCFDVI